MEMNKNEVEIIINDILAANEKKPFWNKDKDIKAVLNELICSRTWRNKIEAYEYTSYILEISSIALRRFEGMERWFWEPELRVDFKNCESYLEDEDSDKYKMLSNYFPLTGTLKECQDTLSRINDLVLINRHTDGVNGEKIANMGKELYEHLANAFTELGTGSEYMTYKDMMVIFRTLVLNGLNNVITLENMVSLSETNKSVFEDRMTVSGGLVFRKTDSDNDNVAQDNEQESLEDSLPPVEDSLPPVPDEQVDDSQTLQEMDSNADNREEISQIELQEDISETIETFVTEDVLEENIGKEELPGKDMDANNESMEQASGLNAMDGYLEPIEIPMAGSSTYNNQLENYQATTHDNKDNNETTAEVEPVRESLFQEKKAEEERKMRCDRAKEALLEPLYLQEAQRKLDLDIVNRLIDGTDFDLQEFIEQFQKIETLYYIAKRKNNNVEMSYFCDTLGDMFISFDRGYYIADHTCERGIKQPDMQKWNETLEHIKKFKAKAGMV